MKKSFLFIIVLFCLCLPFHSKAYQISGYITLKHLNGYTYQATITDFTVGDPENSGNCGVYTDLDSVLIYWGDGASSYLYRSNGNIYPPNTYPGGDSVCDCRKKNIYIGIHTFPGNGVYRVWMDGGKRIANIANMTNSGGQDFSIYNTFILNVITGDTMSSPLISIVPACTYGTVGGKYYFNLGAIVPPGTDSLSFELGNCWDASGYFLPPGVTLNSISDTLYWNSPTSQGLYNFSILTTTYKREIISGHRKQIPVDTMEAEVEVTVNPKVIGINEVAVKKEVVTIFPNPNNGRFQIAISQQLSANSQIEIYNMLGQEVYSNSYQPRAINHQPINIDLSGEPSGVYLYRVITEAGNFVGEGKFIIQK